MKVIVFIALAATSVLTASCFHFKDNDELPHKKKMEAFSDRYCPGRHSDSLLCENNIMDTTVFIAGVEFPEDYDWRRDTSYGNITGRIVLLKDGVRISEIKAGGGAHASTDPDMHHLVDGHIFTEFTDGSMTYIGRDGTELFSYKGCETLRGLVVDSDEVFTLGQRKDGSGFCLRRNGVEIFSREGAVVAGQMTDDRDYPTGALYRDGGHLYFSYWRPLTTSGGGRAWFIVEDGHETQITTAGDGMFDIRIRDGSVIVKPITSFHAVYVSLSDDEYKALVISYPDRTLLISNDSLGFYTFTEEKYYFFSFWNCDLAGDVLYLAITPLEKGKAPVLWKNGALSEININGFVTAVDVSVIPRQSP